MPALSSALPAKSGCRVYGLGVKVLQSLSVKGLRIWGFVLGCAQFGLVSVLCSLKARGIW